MERVIRVTITIVFGFLFDWTAMLAIGAAHSHDGRVPAFGFWTTFFVTWFIGAAVAPSFLSLNMRLDD